MPIVCDPFKQMERSATEVTHGRHVQLGPDLLASCPEHTLETGMGLPQGVCEQAGLPGGKTEAQATDTSIRCTAY